LRFVLIFVGVALALVLLPAGGVAQEADTTQPVVTCDAADGLWHGADVSIACTASDSESGLANPADASFTLTTSVSAGEESADATTDSRQVCDNASNCASAGPVSGNKVDKNSPAAICAAPDGLWHASDVAIACAATDGGSGLADPTQASLLLSTGVAAGTETSNAATSSLSICDAVGNCAPAGPVGGNKVDKKAPIDPPTVRSTDHRIGKWSRDRRIDMYWTGSSDGGSRVDGFSLSWTKLSSSVPDHLKDREQGAHTTTSSRLTTGKWWFHIRTLDNVGNWSLGVDRGPYYIDITRPQVRALSASGRVGHTMRLKYRTADNTHRTRERITVARNGSLVSSWSRRMGTAAWGTVQYVSWTPRTAGSYSFCVRAWDSARNSRRDCAALSIPSPAPPPSNCDSAYPTICLRDGIGDYDCAGGSGDGPNYVYATNFTVRSPDPFGLDADGDGVGCET
jgi:hypothetical protein